MAIIKCLDTSDISCITNSVTEIKNKVEKNENIQSHIIKNIKRNRWVNSNKKKGR